MKVVEDVKSVRVELSGPLRAGRTIGFVPTMGALHQGHLELIRRARSENDVAVVSIFVNPTQFGDPDDFERYPRDLAADAATAEAAGVDVLFAPPASEMYQAGAGTSVDVGRIGETGEGRWRPGHFRGVATVCLKLFNIVSPDRAYFGAKDAQQLAVIRKMAAELDLPLEVVEVPTVREPDGLAASSRNRHLDGPARRAAPVLFRALSRAAEAAAGGESSCARLIELAGEVIAGEPSVRLQYLGVFDPGTFEPLEEAGLRSIMALAAHVGATRLIDNIAIEVPGQKEA